MLTLFIAAAPNGSSVWVRVVDEVSGAVFEQEITADLPANTQFLSPRLLNNEATCSIPDDHIDPRRSAFFMARSVLRDIRNGVLPC